MATQLVESLTRPFDPTEFQNEHKRELLDLVERKLAGEDVPVAVEEPAPAPVPDLMAALQASLEQAKGRERTGSGGGKPASAQPAGRGKRAAPEPAGENGDGTAKPKRRAPARKKAASRGG